MLSLSDVRHNLIWSTDFSKNPQHKTSQKSVQWETNSSMQTDRQTLRSHFVNYFMKTPARKKCPTYKPGWKCGISVQIWMDLYDIYKVFSTALRSIFKENQKEIYVLETRYVPVSALKPKLFVVFPVVVSPSDCRDQNSHRARNASFHIPSQSLFSARPVIRCHIIRYTITVVQYTTNEIKYFAMVNSYQLMRVRNCTPTASTCLQGTTVREGRQAKYLNWPQECFISRTLT